MRRELALMPANMGIVLDKDAVAIGDLYRKARSSMVDSMLDLTEAGHRLIKKKASLERGEWLPWLTANEDVLGFKERAARLMMKGASWVENNLECRNRQLAADLTETEATQLNRMFWGHNVRGTEGTGENEWFTPPEYIALVRTVLGDIDLDPATHARAQETIGATKYFTKQDDGLSQQWHGRVFLNPPYAQPWIAHFVSKMCAERRANRVTAGIMLTHNYTDTSWFHEAALLADAICFTRGRIKFY